MPTQWWLLGVKHIPKGEPSDATNPREHIKGTMWKREQQHPAIQPQLHHCFHLDLSCFLSCRTAQLHHLWQIGFIRHGHEHPTLYLINLDARRRSWPCGQRQHTSGRSISILEERHPTAIHHPERSTEDTSVGSESAIVWMHL